MAKVRRVQLRRRLAQNRQPSPGAARASSPWTLQTPSLSSEFVAFRDEALDPPALVVQVGKTELRYHLRCIEDLHAMLKAHGDWMPLGNADEQKPAADGTVEAWAARREPRRRLVRLEEGTARPLRHVCAAGDGGARSRRSRAQRQEQPHAGEVTN